MDNPNQPEQAKDIVVEVRQIPAVENPIKQKTDYFKLLDMLPKFLWFFFGLFLFCKFYPQIKYDILPNVSSFNIAGFGVTMKEDLSALSEN